MQRIVDANDGAETDINRFGHAGNYETGFGREHYLIPHPADDPLGAAKR